MTRSTKKSGAQSISWKPRAVWADLVHVASKHKLWLVMVVIVLGYLVFRQVEMRIQKAEFRRAETLTTDVVNKIIAQNDSATLEQDKSCGYASAKFSRGRRSCYVGYTLNYGLRSSAEATKMVHQFARQFSEPLESTDSDFIFVYKDGPLQSMHQTINMLSLRCSILYSFEPKSAKAFQYLDKGLLVVTVSCAKEALAEYYPVNK